MKEIKVFLGILTFFQVCIALGMLLFSLTVVMSLYGKRPDFWAYPIYKNAVVGEEKDFQKFVDEICAKKKCENKYEVKVYIWTIPVFVDNAYIANNKTIFLKKSFIEKFNENEIRFILGHELGHAFLKTTDDFQADAFGAGVAGKESGIKALKKTLAIFRGDEFIKNNLDERISALEKKQ